MEVFKNFSLSLWGSQVIEVGECEPETVIDASLIVEFGKVELEIQLDGKTIARTGVVGPGFGSGVKTAKLKVKLPHKGKVSLRLHCPSIPGGAEGTVSLTCQPAEIKEQRKACPVCDAPVEPGAKYCWKCGAKLRQ